LGTSRTFGTLGTVYGGEWKGEERWEENTLQLLFAENHKKIV
jgi:hypothetical protein